MGFFDILGDCISSSLNAIESVGEAIGDAAAGTADAVGNAISFTLTTAENVGAGVGNAVASVAESAVELGHGIVDTVCENPGTTVLVAVGAVGADRKLSQWGCG